MASWLSDLFGSSTQTDASRAAGATGAAAAAEEARRGQKRWDRYGRRRSKLLEMQELDELDLIMQTRERAKPRGRKLADSFLDSVVQEPAARDRMRYRMGT